MLEKCPEVIIGNGGPLDIVDDRAKRAAVSPCALADEPRGCHAVVEIGGVPGGACSIQQRTEVAEQPVAAATGDDRELVNFSLESPARGEIRPEIEDGLPAFLVRHADSQRPLHLAYQTAVGSCWLPP